MDPYRESFPHYPTHPTHSRLSRSSLGTLKNNQKHDALSGQVFTETEVYAGKRYRSDWVGELKTPALVKRRRPNLHGARCLADMAKTTVTRQMRSLSTHHFAEVPVSVAERIWNEITESRSESYHAWRILASVYPEHFRKAKNRYQIEIKQPILPLLEYFKGINSPHSKWLACLRIAPRQISAADLVRISSIKNLTVLDLSDGQTTDDCISTLDERVFKSWAELAESDGAFRHLRVLMLGWQELLSKWIFRYLDSFPSLCCLLVTDSPKIHQRNRPYWEEEATTNGWTAQSAKKSAKRLGPLLDDKNFYLGAISGCYYKAQELYEQGFTDKGSEFPSGLPILECSLGTPKGWTHVVEEYPGTRTVWFVHVKAIATASQTTSAMNMPRDQSKRVRDVETSPKELRSPPAKKKTAKRKPVSRIATELLAEFER